MVTAVAESGNTSLLERSMAAAGVVAMAAGSAVVWYFDPTKAGFFPVCPLYSLTGLACPGCGLTRGFHALFHGDILTALDFNALIPLFVVIFGLLFVSLVMLALRGKGLIRLDQSPKFLVGVFALLIVFGVLRNLPFYPFSILFP
jgi:Protein of unknown function (DUF2752)